MFRPYSRLTSRVVNHLLPFFLSYHALNNRPESCPMENTRSYSSTLVLNPNYSQDGTYTLFHPLPFRLGTFPLCLYSAPALYDLLRRGAPPNLVKLAVAL